ncbi:hypothetical protein HYW44_01875 [Candidatus Daviesbacteria bacterium]|nr:hypothetical protein [Candidatus Daviesbacteria bacterium]
MKQIFNTLLGLLAILILLFLMPEIKKIHAEGIWVVEPVIMIPKNIEADYQKGVYDLNEQKILILDALDDVQNFYQNKVKDTQGNGLTFSYKNEVTVVYTGKDLDYIKGPNGKSIPLDYWNQPSYGCTYGVFLRQGGNNRFGSNPPFLRPSSGKLYMVYVIGTSSTMACAGAGADEGYPKNYQPNAYFSGWHLNCLNPKDELEKPIYCNPLNSKRNIAHELGHSFGLGYSGWAKAHTCSEYNPHFCKNDTPRPLPDEQSVSREIMNYQSSADRLKAPSLDYFFISNTEYNPFVAKLFKSPFLNPNGIYEPPPIEEEQDPFSNYGVGIIKLQNFSVTYQDTVNIVGKGFGPNPDKIRSYLAIFPINNNQPDIDNKLKESEFEIVNWQDDTITFRILKKDMTQIVKYGLLVHTLDGYNFQSSDSQTFELLPFIVDPNRIYNRKIIVNCDNAIFRLKKRDSVGDFVDVQVYENSIDPDPNNRFITFSPKELGADVFRISADPIDGIDASPIARTIDDFSAVDFTYTFDYPNCPSSGDANGKEITSVRVTNRPDIPPLLSGNAEGLGLNLTEFGLTEGEAKEIMFPITIFYNDGSEEQEYLRFKYEPDSGSGTSGKSCIYSEGDVCRQGNCLDGSQNCSYNVNCGFVEGVSSGSEVSCPNTNPTPPPGQSCNEDTYYCDGRKYIHKSGGYWDGDKCVYDFDDQGYVEGKCGVPRCNQDIRYCDGNETIHKFGGYLDKSNGECVYDFDNEGRKEGKCGNPSCDEDTYYCDNGETIHKTGGYFDNGECIYDFQHTGESC